MGTVGGVKGEGMMAPAADGAMVLNVEAAGVVEEDGDEERLCSNMHLSSNFHPGRDCSILVDTDSLPVCQCSVVKDLLCGMFHPSLLQGILLPADQPRPSDPLQCIKHRKLLGLTLETPLLHFLSQ
ncbi:hypothetical protein PRIC2_002097 [Phytophthora ramorum]